MSLVWIHTAVVDVRIRKFSIRPALGARLFLGLAMMGLVSAATGCVGPHPKVETRPDAAPTAAQDAAVQAEADSSAQPQAAEPSVPIPIPLPSAAAGTEAVSAVPDGVPVVEAKPVQVSALRAPYKISQTTTATKTDTPIMQTPFSVQVVPQQVIKDQQAVRLETAVQNVSGVIVQSGANGDTSDSFIIRGFNVDSTYRNGVLGGGNTGLGKREMANVEQVEVLKGPGAILYGRSEPGGIVNLVTKQPLVTPYYSIQQQVGSYNFYRTTADATGPITKDDTLLYRLNMSYENSGSFRHFLGTDSVFVAPVLKWNIGPRTQLTAELEYLHEDRKRDFGIPALGNRPAPVARDLTLIDPSHLRTAGDRYFYSLHGTHRLNADWEVSARGAYTSTNYYVDDSGFFNPVQPNGDAERVFFRGSALEQKYQASLNLTGHLRTGAARHTLLAGYDYFYILGKFDGDNSVLAAPFNIFAPTYGNPAPVFDQGRYAGSNAQTWHGLYLQDQIELPFHLHLLAGLRYDYTMGKDNQADMTTYVEDRFSPRGGLLWNPIPWLSLYGSYTESLGPSNVFFRTDGVKLRPQSAQQWEAGVKTEFFDGRLRITASYFDLTKQNIAVPDPANLLRTRPIGEAHSRGIELDVTGEILPGWHVIAAYTHLPFAKITKDVADDGAGNPTPGGTGNRLFLAARNFGSLWNTYDFQGVRLRGLRVGAGMIAVSEQQGDIANTFQMPGYVTANLMASYQWQVGRTRMTAQLNINNLFDARYFSGSDTFTSVNVGTPRFVMGSLRMEF